MPKHKARPQFSTTENEQFKKSQHASKKLIKLAKQTLLKLQKARAHSTSLAEFEEPDEKTSGDYGHFYPNTNSEQFYLLLKSLNESLVNYITQSIAEEPLRDFTSVFQEYNEHLERLSVPFTTPCYDGHSNSCDISKSNNVPSTTPSTNEGRGNFTINEDVPSSSSVTKPSGISTSRVHPPTLFSISSSAFTHTCKRVDVSGFELGNVRICSPMLSECTDERPKSNCAPESSSKSVNTFEVSSSKVRSRPVQSTNEYSIWKDVLFSKPCFYSKDGDDIEEGTGMLYLRRMDGKLQILVRVDDSSGEILLNALLKSAVSVKIVGKKNVLVASTPSSNVSPRKEEGDGLVILIRLKAERDAKDLVKQIEDFTNGSEE